MEKTEYPLVSCICIAGMKPELLEQAISCFFGQTYEHKELVIIYENGDIATKKAIGIYKNKPNIICLESHRNTTNDEKINLAVNRTKGTYLCFWSAKDWHHSARIEYQYEAITIKEVAACALHYLLLRIENSTDLYISSKRLWAETIFMKKNRFLGKDDEMPFSKRIEKLDTTKQLYYISDVPNLYIYSHYEDRKVLVDGLWSEILKYSSKLALKDSRAIYKILGHREEVNLEKRSKALDKILGNPLFEDEEATAIPHMAKIPKIIHLTFKTKKIPELYRKTFESITSLHPHWKICIYNDEEAENLVANHFPELFEIYSAYPSYIQRVDIFRILVVYLFGGFYLDLDMHCLKSLDELCGSSLILGEEIRYSAIEGKILDFRFESEIQVGNFMFGSVTGHPFWIELLMEIINRSDHKITYELDVLKSTGSGVLSEVYQKVKHNYNDIRLIRNKFKRCHSGCPCVSCHFGDFAAHLHVNGWTWSGKNKEYVDLPTNSDKIMAKVKDKAYATMAKRLIEINKTRCLF